MKLKSKKYYEYLSLKYDIGVLDVTERDRRSVYSNSIKLR